MIIKFDNELMYTATTVNNNKKLSVFVLCYCIILVHTGTIYGFVKCVFVPLQFFKRRCWYDSNSYKSLNKVKVFL